MKQFRLVISSSLRYWMSKTSYTGDQKIRRIRQILNVFDFSFIANFIKLKPGLKLLKIEFSDLVSFPVDKVRLKVWSFNISNLMQKCQRWWSTGGVPMPAPTKDISKFYPPKDHDVHCCIPTPNHFKFFFRSKIYFGLVASTFYYVALTASSRKWGDCVSRLLKVPIGS